MVILNLIWVVKKLLIYKMVQLVQMKRLPLNLLKIKLIHLLLIVEVQELLMVLMV